MYNILNVTLICAHNRSFHIALSLRYLTLTAILKNLNYTFNMN